MGEEPNHTTAREPGLLKIIQYSLYRLYNFRPNFCSSIYKFAETNFIDSVEKPSDNQTQCCARWDKQSQSHFACSDLIITDEIGRGRGGGRGAGTRELRRI